MAGEARSISILPENFAHGGGLLDDADVTIKQARWAYWDYQGKGKRTIACHVTYTDDDGKETDQYYSAGDPEAFCPSKDEKSIVPVGTRDSLSDSTNFFQFISSVFMAGYPPEQVSDSDVSFLEGLKVHVKQEAQPERQGLEQQPKEGGRKRTVLCVAKIYNLPKGAKAGKATSAGATKSTGANTSTKSNGGGAVAAATGLEDAATDALLSVLGDNGGSVTKTKLSQLMFKHLTGNPQRNDIIKLAFEASFLESNPMIRYDGTTIAQAI